MTRKNTNVVFGPWTPPGEKEGNLGNGHVDENGVTPHSSVAEGYSRKLDYTMPLNFTLFPVVKSTRCNIVEKVMHCELDRLVISLSSGMFHSLFLAAML